MFLSKDPLTNALLFFIILMQCIIFSSLSSNMLSNIDNTNMARHPSLTLNHNNTKHNDIIYIFVDIGANIGDTMEEILHVDNIPPIKYIFQDKFEYYAFEANPRFNDVLLDSCNKYIDYVRGCYVETAVSTTNGEVTFYEHKMNQRRINKTNYEAGSLILNSKKNSKKITVKSIDICEWFTMNFDINENNYHFIVKMDVEGFEYSLLPYIYDNCIQYVNVFFIEFHPWGQPKQNSTKKRHWRDLGIEWTQKLKEKGIMVLQWK